MLLSVRLCISASPLRTFDPFDSFVQKFQGHLNYSHVFWCVCFGPLGPQGQARTLKRAASAKSFSSQGFWMGGAVSYNTTQNTLWGLWEVSGVKGTSCGWSWEQWFVNSLWVYGCAFFMHKNANKINFYFVNNSIITTTICTSKLVPTHLNKIL